MPTGEPPAPEHEDSKPHRFTRLIEDARQRAEQSVPHSDVRQDEDLEFLCSSMTDYKIRERIQHGGQGAIYRATHLKTKRDVAIKILLAGPFATERQLVRFEREAELTSRLQHPNIVTLYDYGLVRNRPFIAMQYIKGMPIDDYVVLRDLPAHEIVRLFVTICDAVGYAHRHGIIHRDLNPANILVDESGAPHVLDFGLAKDVWEADDAAHISMAGQVVGKLPYLSPEQAEGRDGEIDTRSDLYSLAVVLYELITDVMPYSVTGSVQKIRSSIVQADPLPLRKAAAAGDADRLPDLRSVNQDLEAILCRALAKEPNARYQSAADFADDLQRYLSGDIVSARTGHTLYMVRKFVRKHRVFAGVSSLFLLVMLSAIVTISLAWAHATAQRDRALTAHRLSHSALDTVLTEVDEHISTLAGGTEVRDRILASVADDVATLSDVVSTDLEMRDLQAALQERLGDMAHLTGRRSEAATHYAQFLAVAQALALDSTSSEFLADVARAHQKLAEVSENPTEHYENALTVAREVVARTSASTDAQYALCQILANYAKTLFLRAEYTLAEKQITTALEFCIPAHNNNPDDARWSTLLATAYDWGGDILGKLNRPQAVEFHVKSMAIREALLARHATDVDLRCKLMLSQAKIGQLRSQEGLFEEALVLLEKADENGQYLVAADPDVAIWKHQLAGTHYELATILLAAERLDEAKAHCETMAHLVASLVRASPNDPKWANMSAFSETLLGQHSLATDAHQEAIAHFRKAVTTWETLTERDPENLDTLSNLADACDRLGSAYAYSGQLDNALRCRERAFDRYSMLADRQPGIPDCTFNLARSRTNLAAVHIRYKSPEHDASAKAMLEEADAMLQRLYEAEHLDHRQRWLDSLTEAIQRNLALLARRAERRNAQPN